jgi:hypothetical protein
MLTPAETQSTADLTDRHGCTLLGINLNSSTLKLTFAAVPV